ncbi:MAG: hypothetical protein IT569_00415 [Leptospiraceae bacterium]|nr:hypothetical protein [Leptospiraceae bacterium]
MNTKNNFLTYLLYTKITLTVSLWALPLLLFPDSMFQFLGLPLITPEYYRRLLGMAYLALVAGYIDALISVRKGIFPEGIVIMGIISNAGASAILAFYGFVLGAFSGLTLIGGALLVFSTFATGVIAVLLAREFLKR